MYSYNSTELPPVEAHKGVRSRERASAAIKRSFGPIGVPARSYDSVLLGGGNNRYVHDLRLHTLYVSIGLWLYEASGIKRRARFLLGSGRGRCRYSCRGRHSRS